MTETNDAKYYQDHKESPGEWGPPRSPSKKPRRLDSLVSVRFSAAEEERLRSKAEQIGTTLSAYVRAAALSASMQLVPSTFKAAGIAFGTSIALSEGVVLEGPIAGQTIYMASAAERPISYVG